MNHYLCKCNEEWAKELIRDKSFFKYRKSLQGSSFSALMCSVGVSYVPKNVTLQTGRPRMSEIGVWGLMT